MALLQHAQRHGANDVIGIDAAAVGAIDCGEWLLVPVDGTDFFVELNALFDGQRFRRVRDFVLYKSIILDENIYDLDGS